MAVKDRKTGLGLPEVMLGLLPGGGGTQRAPKLAGVPNALDLALTGKTVKADRAKKLGIVDLLVDPLGPGLDSSEARTLQYLEEVAIGVARDLAAGKLKVDRSKKGLFDKLFAYALQVNWVRDQIFGKAKKQVLKMTGGLYPAPLRVRKKILSVFIFLYNKKKLQTVFPGFLRNSKHSYVNFLHSCFCYKNKHLTISVINLF